MTESSNPQPPAAPTGDLLDETALRGYFEANIDRFTPEALFFQAVTAGHPAERARQILAAAEAAQPPDRIALRRTARRAILGLFIAGFVAVAVPVLLMWESSYGLALPFVIGQLVLTLIAYALARSGLGATGMAAAPALVLMLISVTLVAQMIGGLPDFFVVGLIALGALGVALVAFAWTRRDRPPERSPAGLLALLAVPLVFFLAFPGTCIYFLYADWSRLFP